VGAWPMCFVAMNKVVPLFLGIHVVAYRLVLWF